MEKEALKGLVKKLQQEIQSSDAMEADVKTLLQSLNEDIDTVLDRDDSPDDPVYAALNERSQSLYANFAVKHPTLEPVLREIGNMLGKMGV